MCWAILLKFPRETLNRMIIMFVETLSVSKEWNVRMKSNCVVRREWKFSCAMPVDVSKDDTWTEHWTRPPFLEKI